MIAIKTKEREVTYGDIVEKTHTIDELLELFDDEHNVVRPLCLLVQKYERFVQLVSSKIHHTGPEWDVVRDALAELVAKEEQ